MCKDPNHNEVDLVDDLRTLSTRRCDIFPPPSSLLPPNYAGELIVHKLLNGKRLELLKR